MVKSASFFFLLPTFLLVVLAGTVVTVAVKHDRIVKVVTISVIASSRVAQAKALASANLRVLSIAGFPGCAV